MLYTLISASYLLSGVFFLILGSGTLTALLEFHIGHAGFSSQTTGLIMSPISSASLLDLFMPTS